MYKLMLKDFFKTGKNSIIPFIEKIEDKDNLHVVRLKGPIDMTTVPQVENLIWKARVNRGLLNKDILLDFKNVTHIDSSIIALLLMALSDLKHEKHKLVLINIPSEFKDMVAIENLNALFCICDSESDALEHIRNA
jgi:anti-anti-sigma factor